VGVEGGHLHGAAHEHGLPAGRDAAQAARVRGPQLGRHDQLRDGPPHRLLGRVAEQPSGPRVPLGDDALGVHSDVRGWLGGHATDTS
jgi:hypothetical protein